MLRIEEIVGAMDDEFRILLDGLDDEGLTALKADAKALRRLRPVGVSQTEAQAMILALQRTRARKAAALARQDRRRRMVAEIRARRSIHVPVSSRQSEAPSLSSRQSEATRDPSRTMHERSLSSLGMTVSPPPRRRPLLLLAGAVALVLIALLASR